MDLEHDVQLQMECHEAVVLRTLEVACEEEGGHTHNKRRKVQEEEDAVLRNSGVVEVAEAGEAL